MFSSNNRSTQLSCGFKVNTSSPAWHKSMTKVLKKIKGGDFALDVDQGMAYVSGQGDPNKLLKLMGSKKGQGAEMMFVKTSGHHQQHHHHHHHHHHPPDHPNLYHNNYYNSHYAQSQSYWPKSDYGYSRQHLPYYPQSQAMQPYHRQYSYPGYNNYGYY